MAENFYSSDYQSQYAHDDDGYDHPNNGEQNSYGRSYGGSGQYDQNGQYGRSNGQYDQNGQYGRSNGQYERNYAPRRSNGDQYEQGGSNYKNNYRYNRRFEGGNQYRSNQGQDDGLKFTIVESYGVFHTDPRSGYTKEVNLVSWNEAKPKYDIRPWSPDHKKMGKGLTFTADEFIMLNTITSAMISSKPELKSRYMELLNDKLNDPTDQKSAIATASDMSTLGVQSNLTSAKPQESATDLADDDEASTSF